MTPIETVALPAASSVERPATADESPILKRARRILAGTIRPDDYLPVTPEVQRHVDLDMTWARTRANDIPLDPEVERRQLRQELLSFHHGGENILYLENDTGIVVLGVGLEESGLVFRTLAATTEQILCAGFPERWQ